MCSVFCNWCIRLIFSMNIICDICDKKFLTARRVNKHKIRFHHLKRITGGTLKCPYCGLAVRKQKELCLHVCNTHSINCEMDEIYFDDLEAFSTWKNQIEKNTKSKYVQISGTRKSMDSVKTYFLCHRQGTYKDKVGGNRKRRMKKQGTNKTGFGCTSFIELYNGGGKIKAEYWKTHCGHTCNYDRLSLSKDDRTFIAGLIQSGMSPQDIVEQIRANAVSENSERLQMITSRDVHNISRDFGVGKRIKLEPDDAPSEDLGIASVVTLGESDVETDENNDLGDLPTVARDGTTELFSSYATASIQQKLQLISQFAASTHLDAECAELVGHYLDRVLELLELVRSSSKSVVVLPTKLNLESEDSLQSLDLWETDSVNFSKPLNIHSTFDHIY